MIEKVCVPEGNSGAWSVKRFTVSPGQAKFEAMRAAFGGGRGVMRAGTYTSLVHATRGVVMSDTPDEMRDHYESVAYAHNHVLINGLGIGMALGAVLKKEQVERVTVVELSEDIINLVAPHYACDRLNIIHADAFDYIPPKGVKYGTVWRDIWDAICADNLPEMTRLKRKFGRRTNWQGCWAEYECRRLFKKQ